MWMALVLGIVATLEPRAPFALPADLRPHAGQNASEIVVKFVEGSDARFAIDSLAALADRVEPVFDRPAAALAADKAAGEAATGRELPDLTLFHRIHLRTGVDPAASLEHILALRFVETAVFAPSPIAPPSDIPPQTPDLTQYQSYPRAAPAGVDSAYARAIPGGSGAGVRVCDIEYTWRVSHEDLCGVPVQFVTAAPLVPPGVNAIAVSYHGSASMGVIGADDNGYGMIGIASEAALLFGGAFTQAGGLNVANAINLASAALSPGDVILLELQVAGPNYNPLDPNNPSFGSVPVEWNAAEWAAIATATANGRIVVEPAGNGSQNLNDPVYGQAFDRRAGDSGAILVAACDTSGNPFSFTNYGSPFGPTVSRIDAWSRGHFVATLGYGDIQHPGFDDNQAYTAHFGGTSAASAIVAGCAASLQGISQEMLGRTLSPAALRAALVSTGTPQVPDLRHVGTQPNLRAASEAILSAAVPLSFTALVRATPAGFDLVGVAALAMPDLDGDGVLDLVIGRTNQTSGAASVETFLNRGLQGFVAWSGPVAVGMGGVRLVTGDLDGDGRADAVACAGINVAILRGDGSGGFGGVQSIPLGLAGGSPDVVDFDLDGRLDVIVPHAGGVTIVVGNGMGGGTPSFHAFGGANWTSVRAASIDGDGWPDLCLVGPISTDVLRNGPLGAPLGGSNTAPVPGTALAVGDLDHDGRLDLAVCDAPGAALTVVSNLGFTGSMTIGAPLALPGPMVAGEISLGNVDGDLVPDAVVSGVPIPNQGGGVAIALGSGRGGFALAGSTLVGGNPGEAALADVDGDGDADVVCTMYAGLVSGAVVLTSGAPQRGPRCRTGGVNATAGVAFDVLRVNGSAGNVDRTVRVAPGAPVTIAMVAPIAGPASARFVLWAVRRRVGFSNATTLPAGVGMTCFPTPVTGATLPTTVTVANSLGFTGRLGRPLRNVSPAPTTVIRVNGGFAPLTVLSLQGLVQDSASLARGVSVTNFVEVLVR